MLLPFDSNFKLHLSATPQIGFLRKHYDAPANDKSNLIVTLFTQKTRVRRNVLQHRKYTGIPAAHVQRHQKLYNKFL